MRDDYDLAIIGAGPAGEKAAIKAAWHGKRVVVVDRDAAAGSACVRGGIPSKILREIALCYSGSRRHLEDVYGAPRPASMQAMLRRVRGVCDERVGRVRRSLEEHAVELRVGAARFEDPHTLAIAHVDGGTSTLRAGVILIATGSRPVRPRAFPFDGIHVHTSDTILDVPDVPRTFVVIGGGAIGAEYASIFAALGSHVALVEERARIVDFADDEVSDRLMEAFRAAGIALHLGERVERCELAAPGRVRVQTSSTTLEAEQLLFSGGRRANTRELGLESIGAVLDERGSPRVDAHGRLDGFDHLYAAGDVVGFPQLASIAMEQGRAAVAHAFDLGELATHGGVPHALYTLPSCAAVGATERELAAAGKPYLVGRAGYADRDRGHIMGDPHGMLKLLADPASRRVLGVHIVGEHAEELVHVGQACMHFEGTIDYFLRAVLNFPTLSELYKRAAYDVLSQLEPGRAPPE